MKITDLEEIIMRAKSANKTDVTFYTRGNLHAHLSTDEFFSSTVIANGISYISLPDKPHVICIGLLENLHYDEL